MFLRTVRDYNLYLYMTSMRAGDTVRSDESYVFFYTCGSYVWVGINVNTIRLYNCIYFFQTKWLELTNYVITKRKHLLLFGIEKTCSRRVSPRCKCISYVLKLVELGRSSAKFGLFAKHSRRGVYLLTTALTTFVYLLSLQNLRDS